jgi:hypothetical protein
MSYINWLKARIEHAIESGELRMLDGLAIARAWMAREGATE